MKVGFLFNGEEASDWQLAIVREVSRREGVQVTTLTINVVRPPRRGPLWKRARQWFAEDARMIESRLFRRTVRFQPPLADLESTQSLPAQGVVQHLRLADVQLRDGGRLAAGAEALRALGELQLDVLVSFVGYACEQSLCDSARLGVWALHHADGRIIGPWMSVGFWECYHGLRRTLVSLERLSTRPLDRWVIRRGWYPTELSSWTRNELTVMEHARHLVADALRHAQISGRLPAAPSEDLDSSEQPLCRTPGPLRYWLGMLRLTTRWIAYFFKSKLFVEQWYLLIGHAASPLSVDTRALAPAAAPRGTWWADPFLLQEGGRTWLYAEEKPLDRHADICAFEWREDGLQRIGTALSTGYHLSYPFVFKYQGRWHMIPETSQNRTIELWECTELPLQWRRRKVLMSNLVAADTTLLFRDGRWWMFTNIARSKLMPNLCIELFVFSTDDLVDGEWLPHDANPVVSDCRRARMAGPIVEHEGTLYRSCQRNSLTYGEAVEICRIERLDQHEYREHVVRVYEPDELPGVSGLHHLCHGGGLVTVDVKRRLFKGLL